MLVKQAIMACALAIPAVAEAQADPAAAFGARESVQDISLSPDGTRIAFIAPDRTKGSALYFAPVDGSSPPLRTLIATGEPEHLGRCNWVSAVRVVCSVYSLNQKAGELVGASRMVAANIDGSQVKMVTRRDSEQQIGTAGFGGNVIDWLPGEDGAVLVTRVFIPKVGLDVTVIGGSIDGIGVERVDTTTLASKRVIAPVKAAVEFISDGHGIVRIMGSRATKAEYSDSQYIDYSYRRAGDNDWKQLGRFDTLREEGFNPVAVDSAENVVYGFQKKTGARRFTNDPSAVTSPKRSCLPDQILMSTA
jgi:hypothetical protein